MKILAESNHPLAKIILSSANENEMGRIREMIRLLKSLDENKLKSDFEIANKVTQMLTTCRV